MTADGIDTTLWPVYPGPAHPFQGEGARRCTRTLPAPCGRFPGDVAHRKPWCAACQHRHWQDDPHTWNEEV